MTQNKNTDTGNLIDEYGCKKWKQNSLKNKNLGLSQINLKEK